MEYAGSFAYMIVLSGDRSSLTSFPFFNPFIFSCFIHLAKTLSTIWMRLERLSILAKTARKIRDQFPWWTQMQKFSTQYLETELKSTLRPYIMASLLTVWGYSPLRQEGHGRNVRWPHFIHNGSGAQLTFSFVWLTFRTCVTHIQGVSSTFS